MKQNATIIINYLIKVMIIALLLGAAIGMFVILAGNFNRTLTNSLTTCFTIAAYSISALCSLTIYNKLKSFSLAGLWVAAIGLFIALIIIWDIIDFDIIWKPMAISIILSAAIAQISLLLLINPIAKLVKLVRMITISFIILTTLMLIKSVLTEYEESKLYFKILMVCAICYLLGIIITPILNKTITKK